MNENVLGKEYEEWLDEVEKTLPLLIIPKEEDNGKKLIVTTDS